MTMPGTEEPMTTEPTLGERLVSMKKPCPHYRGETWTALNGTLKGCVDCDGTGEAYVLPDCVRVRHDPYSHLVTVHGLKGDFSEYVDCKKAPCTGFGASTREEDWWRAWGESAPGREIGIHVQLYDGVVQLTGSVALLGRFEGESGVDVLQKAIEAALKETA